MLVRFAHPRRRPLRLSAWVRIATLAGCCGSLHASPASAADLIEARRLYQTGDYAGCAAAAPLQTPILQAMSRPIQDVLPFIFWLL